MAKMELSHWTNALPEQFPFYHLGNVEQMVPAEAAAAVELRPDMAALGFSLQGDARGMLVVLFDQGLDASTYTEMGNILASQLATRLWDQGSLEVMISPPLPLSEAQVRAAIESAEEVIRRTYVHAHDNILIPVQLVLLPSSTDIGAGNA